MLQDHLSCRNNALPPLVQHFILRVAHALLLNEAQFDFQIHNII